MGKAWLIYQWQRYIRAGTVLRPRALPYRRALIFRPVAFGIELRRGSIATRSCSCIVEHPKVSGQRVTQPTQCRTAIGSARKESRADGEDSQSLHRQQALCGWAKEVIEGERYLASMRIHRSCFAVLRASLLPTWRAGKSPCIAGRGQVNARAATPLAPSSPCTPLPTLPLMCPSAMPPASPLVSPCLARPEPGPFSLRRRLARRPALHRPVRHDARLPACGAAPGLTRVCHGLPGPSRRSSNLHPSHHPYPSSPMASLPEMHLETA